MSQPGQLVEEWSAGRHEQPDGFGQAGPRRRQPAGQVVDQRRRLELGARALGRVGGVGIEVGDQGGDQLPAVRR